MLPNHYHYSHEDSIEQQKFKAYDNIRYYYFLYRNEYISDSAMLNLYNTGIRVDDKFINEQFENYRKKTWELEKVNPEGYKFLNRKPQTNPRIDELDSMLNSMQLK